MLGEAIDDTKVAMCIQCGCDDWHACEDPATSGPCSWDRVDRESGLGVCSACPEALERWDNGDRNIAVPAAPGGEDGG